MEKIYVDLKSCKATFEQKKMCFDILKVNVRSKKHYINSAVLEM